MVPQQRQNIYPVGVSFNAEFKVQLHHHLHLHVHDLLLAENSIVLGVDLLMAEHSCEEIWELGSIKVEFMVGGIL